MRPATPPRKLPTRESPSCGAPAVLIRGYSPLMPRVCRSAHHRVNANPTKATVMATTSMAVSVVILSLPCKNGSSMTEAVHGHFDRSQISRRAAAVRDQALIFGQPLLAHAIRAMTADPGLQIAIVFAVIQFVTVPDHNDGSARRRS